MTKLIRCKECGETFEPIIVDDKVHNKGIKQDCPNCGEVNLFKPSEVDGKGDDVLGK